MQPIRLRTGHQRRLPQRQLAAVETALIVRPDVQTPRARGRQRRAPEYRPRRRKVPTMTTRLIVLSVDRGTCVVWQGSSL
jgi:hypothetical protein